MSDKPSSPNDGSTESSAFDDTLFPASEKTPGQAESRRAYQEIEERLSEYTWFADYQSLRSQGWDWRKAIYIAWESSPGVGREPQTQYELATDVLGLTDDRTIRKWKSKQPEIETAIVELAAAPLLKHRRDIYDALISSAINSAPASHSDRKLALEMLGDYVPKSKQQLTGKDEGPIEYRDASELSDDELALIAAGRSPGAAPSSKRKK